MPVKVLEITPNSLLYNEKYKDDLKVWTVASKNANGRERKGCVWFVIAWKVLIL
jgi:hypothetical protein